MDPLFDEILCLIVLAVGLAYGAFKRLFERWQQRQADLRLGGKRGRVRVQKPLVAPSGEVCGAMRVRLYQVDHRSDVPSIGRIYLDKPPQEPWLIHESVVTGGLFVDFEDGTVLEVPEGTVQLSGKAKRRTTRLSPHAAAYFEARGVEVPLFFELEETTLLDGATVAFVGATELRGQGGDYRKGVLSPQGIPFLAVV